MVRELAKRVDELQRKAPPAASMAAVPAPAAEIAAVGQSRPPKKSWAKRKPEDRKRRRTDDGGQGGQGDAKRKLPGPWVAMGLCKLHYKYWDGANNCWPPCLRAGN